MGTKNTKITMRERGKKGGDARALALSEAERRSLASEAAKARWAIPKATHDGTLRLGDLELPCANLPDGRRVISEGAMLAALGRGYSGYYSQRDAAAGGTAAPPRYFSPAVLKPFISEDLAALQPVPYRTTGGLVGKGVLAEAVPQICEVWLRARDAGKLTPTQLRTAAKAEVIIRGLARVGIIALVDEATGYQADRARDELNTILQRYIAEELRPWVKRFPDELFRQIYRLQGWVYKPGNRKGPLYVGKLINRYIYDQLPPGVPEKLRALNPVDADTGRRRHKHHQLLTDHTGVPHLDRQIVAVVTLMKVSEDRPQFEAFFQKAHPRLGDQLPLTLPSADEDD